MAPSTLAPVALFAYARPDHLRMTVEALAQNELARDTELIVFSDGMRTETDGPAVAAVRDYLKGVSGFASVTVHERARNFGLADSIVDGVSRTVERYGRVIVIEDDIVTSPFFLRYMNEALERYADEPRVMHIAGYMLDIDPKEMPESFFMRQSSCWGWATWKRAWQFFHRDGAAHIRSFAPEDIQRFNLDGAYDYWGQLLANESGLLKSWAIYWYACVFSKNGLCLHPRVSLVENIGHDGSGINCGVSTVFGGPASAAPVECFPEIIEENTEAASRIRAFWCPGGKKSQGDDFLRKAIERVGDFFSSR